METVLSLRGCNNATVKDLVDLKRLLLQQFKELGQSMVYRPRTDPNFVGILDVGFMLVGIVQRSETMPKHVKHFQDNLHI